MASPITRRMALGAIAGSIAAMRAPIAGAAEPLRIGKSVIENIGYIPLDVGMETGIFERNGLAVQAINFEGAARLHQAMIAGSALIVVLFLADVGLGLLTRVAPALNAFSLGFPLKIMLTVVLSAIVFVALPGVVSGLTDTAVKTMLGVGR